MVNASDIIRDLDLIRSTSPLIHNITNYVVMNNTANALLAIGASPVMAHSLEEAADMASIASAVVINIGTLEPEWVKAMFMAGMTAQTKSIPVVFDPVGAGATAYRTHISGEIIEKCKPLVIRGNASEIMALAGSKVQTKGVDSVNASEIAIEAAVSLAKATGSVVVVSGQTDYITDGERTETIRNGHVMMPRVTGMGCTATAIIASFAAINGNMLEAASHGMAVMGIAGEIAAGYSRGTGSMQLNFLDELYALDYETIQTRLK